MDRSVDTEGIRRFLLSIDPWVLERQKELTAIPAPPFGEGPRGDRMAELFLEIGLEGVRKDEEGNVLAVLPDSPPGEDALVVSAHLDTVFPPGTEVVPRESRGVIRAPGIADDARGLTALLALARTLNEHLPTTPGPFLLAATVGEEGTGNLRGVRHLFRGGGPCAKASGFISLDGVGLDRVITRGVGSARLRIQLRGPGGHSWTDWGLPNPIHLLGKVIAGMEELPLPAEPRTTATAARWGGGRSINAIPQEAWAELDLRSEGEKELLRLEEDFLARCRQVVEAGNRAAHASAEGGINLEVIELGRRPAGRTEEKSPLVEAAIRATRALDVIPRLTSSSTDANVPMALGIPAITLGAGGRAGGIHTLEEWYSNEDGPEGILRAVLTILYSYAKE
jgi:acetylornithine deacetylase/succinyl-diaminopimelate desuccinylase-like protein